MPHSAQSFRRFLKLFTELAETAVLRKPFIHNALTSGEGRSLGVKISGGRGLPPANMLIPLERQLIALQLCR